MKLSTPSLTWRNSRASRTSKQLRRLRIFRALAIVLTLGNLLWFIFAWRSLLPLFPSDNISIDGKPVECFMYKPDPNQRFLIFGQTAGQGAGNIMSGLLAVHTLGREFDRTVCIHSLYTDFHQAFRLVDDNTIQACRLLFACETPSFGSATRTNNVVRLINFHSPPNECLLQEILASTAMEHRIVWSEANTYPRWTPTPTFFFTDYYQPTPALLKMIPWKTPPHRVVHLRAPDSTTDVRKGLNDATLEALGKKLPRDTYLVTNKVMWYNWFAERYGWSHPPWQGVIHSALAVSWGDRTGNNIPRVVQDNQGQEKTNSNLELWADWYTILRASSVIHTHSDFSASATHWMNLADSHVLDFANPKDGTLRLLPEEWQQQHDPPVAPLSQRRSDPQLPDEQQLKYCDSTTPLSGFVGYH